MAQGETLGRRNTREINGYPFTTFQWSFDRSRPRGELPDWECSTLRGGNSTLPLPESLGSSQWLFFTTDVLVRFLPGTDTVGPGKESLARLQASITFLMQ